MCPRHVTLEMFVKRKGNVPEVSSGMKSGGITTSKYETYRGGDEKRKVAARTITTITDLKCLLG